MFTIAPLSCSSMPGRNARSVRCIDLTLRSIEKSQSSSEQSSTVPLCTTPAALSRISIGPTRLAIAATAAVSRTSSRATSDTPSLASAARPFSSISVANTVAPSRANAMAEARPMPAAPAVTNARLPLRRSDMSFLPFNSLSSFRGARSASPESITTIGSMDSGPALRASRNDSDYLMIIPRRADAAGDVVIARCELHASAGGLLADGRAIELLPRRLVGRIGEAAPGFQLGAALLQLLIGNQNVGAALVEVDADLVAGLEDRKPAVGGG